MTQLYYILIPIIIIGVPYGLGTMLRDREKGARILMITGLVSTLIIGSAFPYWYFLAQMSGYPPESLSYFIWFMPIPSFILIIGILLTLLFKRKRNGSQEETEHSLL